MKNDVEFTPGERKMSDSWSQKNKTQLPLSSPVSNQEDVKFYCFFFTFETMKHWQKKK